MTAPDTRATVLTRLRAAMTAGDDVVAIRLRRVLRDLEDAEPVPPAGWLLLPLDLGPDGPAVIAVRDR